MEIIFKFIFSPYIKVNYQFMLFCVTVLESFHICLLAGVFTKVDQETNYTLINILFFSLRPFILPCGVSVH